MRSGNRHAEAHVLRRRIVASPQTTPARCCPVRPYVLSSTHRLQDPARPRRSIAAIPFAQSWSLNRYLLIPWRHAFIIFHRIAETFSLNAKLAQSVKGHQSPMCVEGHDVGEDATERKS